MVDNIFLNYFYHSSNFADTPFGHKGLSINNFSLKMGRGQPKANIF